MYEIQGKFKYDRWKVLDEAKTPEEAQEKYGKYRFELSADWLLVVVEKVEPKGDVA